MFQTSWIVLLLRKNKNQTNKPTISYTHTDITLGILYTIIGMIGKLAIEIDTILIVIYIGLCLILITGFGFLGPEKMFDPKGFSRALLAWIISSIVIFPFVY